MIVTLVAFVFADVYAELAYDCARLAAVYAELAYDAVTVLLIAFVFAVSYAA